MPDLAIAAVQKNESSSILDWVAWHLELGFEEIFLADDNSFDGSLELCEALSIISPLKVLDDFSKVPNAQLGAYKAILRSASSECIAFVDLDEFFFSDKGPEAVKAFLQSAFDDPLVSAIAVNWRIAGNSGVGLSSFGSPIRNSWLVSDIDFRKNHHFKSVVRKVRVASMDAHHAKLKFGIYLHGDSFKHLSGPNSEAKIGQEDNYPCSGLSGTVIHEPIHLLHFANKGSLEDFKLNRLWRGDAMGAFDQGAKATHDFYATHNVAGTARELPLVHRRGFESRWKFLAGELCRRTGLTSDLKLTISEVFRLRPGACEIQVRLSSTDSFSGHIEVQSDKKVAFRKEVSLSAGSDLQMRFELDTDSQEVLIRIPGAWTGRLRLSKEDGTYKVDEVYNELTFRLSRAERLLLEERVRRLEAENSHREAMELSLDGHTESLRKLDQAEKRIRELEALKIVRLARFFRLFS